MFCHTIKIVRQACKITWQTRKFDGLIVYRHSFVIGDGFRSEIFFRRDVPPQDNFDETAMDYFSMNCRTNCATGELNSWLTEKSGDIVFFNEIRWIAQNTRTANHTSHHN